ncbi:MAG: hypothetical protein QOD58_4118 [Mycobacterium sp.]|nr:hypothetical protein [Mycobacterium sp.]
MGVLEAPFFVSPRQPTRRVSTMRKTAKSSLTPTIAHKRDTFPACALGSISTHNAKCNAKDTGTRRNLRD